jgi:hypothetical protein
MATASSLQGKGILPCRHRCAGRFHRRKRRTVTLRASVSSGRSRLVLRDEVSRRTRAGAHGPIVTALRIGARCDGNQPDLANTGRRLPTSNASASVAEAGSHRPRVVPTGGGPSRGGLLGADSRRDPATNSHPIRAESAKSDRQQPRNTSSSHFDCLPVS